MEKDIFVFFCEVVTNGTIYNENVGKKLNEFAIYILKKRNTILGSDFTTPPCRINISIYEHENDIYKKNIQLYQNVLNDNVDIYVNYNEKDLKDKRYAIQYMGNAVENYELLKEKGWTFRVKNKNHALRNPCNNEILSKIYLCINGNVLPTTSYSYDLEDMQMNVMGNVLEEDIDTMMERWNFEHPLDYHLGKVVDFYENVIFNYEMGYTQIFNNEIAIPITKEIVEKYKKNLEFLKEYEKIKKILHKRYRYLSFDELMLLVEYYMRIESKEKWCDFKKEMHIKDYSFGKEFEKKTNISLEVAKERFKELQLKNENREKKEENIFYEHNEEMKELKKIIPSLSMLDCKEIKNNIEHIKRFKLKQGEKFQKIIERSYRVLRLYSKKYNEDILSYVKKLI